MKMSAKLMGAGGTGQKKDRYQVVLSQNGVKTRLLVRKEKVKRANANAWFYLGLTGQIGFAIALPIAGGAFLGKYLDTKWSSYPRATLVLLFIGVCIALVGFVQAIQEI